MEIIETLRQAIDALTEVRDLIQWAELDGYGVLKPDPDRPTRVPPLPEPGEPEGGPDYVPGPRDDLGIGAHRSKAAYLAACRHLAAAVREMDALRDEVRGKPCERRGPRVRPTHLSTALAGVDWLARHLDLAAEIRLGPADRARALKVARLAFMAQDVLTSALNKGPATMASTALEKRCRVCRRPMEGAHAARNAICTLCRNVRRNDARKLKRKKQGKQSRKVVDVARREQGSFTKAVDAQRRRIARGEGIREEFGCVTVVRDVKAWRV